MTCLGKQIRFKRYTFMLGRQLRLNGSRFYKVLEYFHVPNYAILSCYVTSFSSLIEVQSMYMQLSLSLCVLCVRAWVLAYECIYRYVCICIRMWMSVRVCGCLRACFKQYTQIIIPYKIVITIIILSFLPFARGKVLEFVYKMLKELSHIPTTVLTSLSSI